MAMTDTILFVKETKTCSYVLVINTPRLCGEPGFKSRRDSGEQGYIRCREIIDSTANTNPDRESLPEDDSPRKLPPRKPIPLAAAQPSSTATNPSADGDEKQSQNKGKMYNDILLKALKALADDPDLVFLDKVTFEKISDDGELTDEALDGARVVGTADSARITDALRAAGFNIKGEKTGSRRKQDEEETEGDKDTTVDSHRDEL